jgi:hypothetical protein
VTGPVTWLLARLFVSDVVPHRRAVLDALARLPALPEADRMRSRETTRAKVRTITDWSQRYDTRRAS